jgi:hypothetical protein
MCSAGAAEWLPPVDACFLIPLPCEASSAMAQIFPESTNTFAKATIFGAAFIVAAVAWAVSMWARSSYVTEVNVVRDQPVPFSHDHHVSGLGIDCRYCHTTVETSPFAGSPATEICMGCHAQIWNDSPLLAPVRESYRTGKPLEWTRVHDLPDFVYFDHSIHVAKGIGCESCHGRVDRMPLMRRAASLQMEWCLECHRDPEPNVRPKSELFAFGQLGRPPAADRPRNIRTETETDPLSPGPQARKVGVDAGAKRNGTNRTSHADLVEEYRIVKSQLTDCVICHR